MKEEITNAQLFRFCAGETTVKENDRIAAWLDENPEEHQQRLNDVHSMYLVSILCDESEAKLPTRRPLLSVGMLPALPPPCWSDLQAAMHSLPSG